MRSQSTYFFVPRDELSLVYSSTVTVDQILKLVFSRFINPIRIGQLSVRKSLGRNNFQTSGPES